MSKIRLLAGIFGLIVSLNLVGQTASTDFNRIYQILKQKDFFTAKKEYEANKTSFTKTYQNYIEAVLDNAFNKLTASQERVNALTNGKSDLPDSLLFKLYELKTDNSLKLYDYKGAKVVITKILKEYKTYLKGSEVKEYENTLKLWSALEDVPAQKVEINRDTKMKLVKDRIGLRNLSLAVNDTTVHFIFDTGANISTTTHTMAERLKLKIIPANIEVNTITGKKVMADLGVCEHMKLGNIDISNAVFLVMPDEVLHIPQVDFQINGILGYPVIAALREVTITKKGDFIVPKEESRIQFSSNMAMDGLTPMICISERHYTFDTGADETILYHAFYEENKAKIDKHYKLKKVNFGGAGGVVEFDGFLIKHRFNIAGEKLTLKKIQLLKDKVDDSETVYGNIGQDVIQHFNAMTLNFDGMFIYFN